MSLKEVMSAYIQEHGMSLRQFGRACGLNHMFIQSLITGHNRQTGAEVHPTERTIAAIAKGMNLTMEDLLERLYDVVSLSNLSEEQKSVLRNMAAMLRKQG